MKNAKKALTVILAGALCLSAASAHADFYDDAMAGFLEERAEAAVSALTEKNIFMGTENGLEADREVSRAEALALAMRCFDVYIPRDANSENAPFDDISAAHWAADNITYAKSRGWINGTGDNLFEPERTVSGKELCKMLLTVRGDRNVTIENIDMFAAEAGLFAWRSEETLLNKDALTRADTAILCYNALDIPVVPEQGVCAPTFAQRLADLMPDDKNYCISPYSLQTALAMAANGAQGDNRKEILGLLGIDKLDDFNASVKAQTARYENCEKLTIETANSIWLNETEAAGNKFSDIFKTAIADFYSGEARTSDKEHVVEEVNGWVNEKTHEKIPSLLSKDDNECAAYLVNAVYFLGDWADPFDAAYTRDRLFTARDGVEKEIPFMNDTKNVLYYGDSHTQMIALPYKEDGQGNSFNMYFAITDGECPLEEYIPQMRIRSVNIALPKFKTEYTKDFTEMLKTMGLKNCMEFSDGFEPMFSPANVPFKIDKVLQKTYLAVDEKGTEAAAATAIGMGAGSAISDRPVSIPFVADRPFTYFIYDELAQEILFIGEYAF